ncbi:MAG: GAF domain-containing sensor histidine kinase [Verrucomicrobiales bacterium]|nr:GAF domain-containing sensor histidine kinase [Verrucomicrobiales bacterium]
MTANYCEPPDHDKEEARLAALDRYKVLDTPREKEFDEIARLASNICDAPIAVVNFIGRRRQFFKAEVGMGIRESPFETSFCGHALLEDDVLVIPDTTLDSRFQNNPLVMGEPNLRFYGGVLIRTPEDLPIGTVCVLDFKTRSLTDRQLDSLKLLSQHAMLLLQLRSNMEDLDRSLSFQERLLQVVSHDLRTPLNVIKINSGILSENPGLNDSQIAGIANRLMVASDSMQHLVDDLLHHDSLYRNEVSLNPRRCEVDSLMEDLENKFVDLAKDKSINFSVTTGEEVSAIHCDPARLSQVFSNLCSNALKFCSPGDRLSVSVQNAPGNLVRFIFEDTGPGIPPGSEDSIFEPLWRADQQSAEGIGLGLSIVKNLLERLDGTIRLDTEYHNGARFICEIPACS